MTPAARLHVFRIEEGLGNACLLVFPDETIGIVDWGTQADEPLREAAALAANNRVRFVAATHPHRDHTLGLEGLLHRFVAAGATVEGFVYPVLTPTISPKTKVRDPLTRALLAAHRLKIQPQPVFVSTLHDPDAKPPRLAFEADWEVRVLAPSSTAIGDEQARAVLGGIVAGNATSMVLGFAFAPQPTGRESFGRALLPGDATPKTLAFARRTAARFPELTLVNQAVVVPHHGGGGTLPSWFEQAIDGIAVVSSPTESRAHPAEPTLKQLVRICSGGQPSRLFCTSYAGACEERFRRAAPAGDRHLVSPGPCFGNLVIEIPRHGPARVLSSSAPGGLRRRYGLCGAP